MLAMDVNAWLLQMATSMAEELAGTAEMFLHNLTVIWQG